jgi:hyperosmotically inducible periplasmic protein
MKFTARWNVIVPATIFSLAMVGPVFGQSNPSASDSMGVAGHSMKQAGSDTADATKHAYEGTATALSDTKITAKVKSALHKKSITEHSEIHVRTTGGIVTLTGRVPSSAIAARAERVTQSTAGVSKVDNKLIVSRTSASN